MYPPAVGEGQVAYGGGLVVSCKQHKPLCTQPTRLARERENNVQKCGGRIVATAASPSTTGVRTPSSFVNRDTTRRPAHSVRSTVSSVETRTEHSCEARAKTLASSHAANTATNSPESLPKCDSPPYSTRALSDHANDKRSQSQGPTMGSCVLRAGNATPWQVSGSGINCEHSSALPYSITMSGVVTLLGVY